MPARLGSIILSNSKRTINKFIHEIGRFKTHNVYHTDTDSLYIEKKNWDILHKTGLVGEKLCEGKNDYENGGIFIGCFLQLK